LNLYWKDFVFIKKIESIYIFGYKNYGNYEKPKKGGELSFAWIGEYVLAIDKDCIKPLTKKELISLGKIKKFEELKNDYDKKYIDSEKIFNIIQYQNRFNDKDFLLAFSVLCEIIDNIIDLNLNK
jgi:hypothetical protein